MKKEKQKHIERSERASLSVFKRIVLFIFSLVLLIIQLLLIYIVFFKAPRISWIYIIVRIIGLICVIAIFDKNMVGSYKLLWTILILIAPFIGTILFLLYGDERSFPKHKSRKIHKTIDKYLPVNKYETFIKKIDPIAHKHITIVNNSTQLPIYTNTDVVFYSDIEKKALDLLDDYDHRTLKKIDGSVDERKIEYKNCIEIINKLRFNEESTLFAVERDRGLESIIGNIYQSFAGKEIYKSVEEKGANFLYLIVKNHVFADGNKRIAATLFIYFLNFYGILYKNGEQTIDNNTLAALTLLIAESNPKEKDVIIDLVMNFLNN